MIITTSHATLKDGNIFEAPANTIWETLAREKKNFIFLRHSMDGNMPSELYIYKNGKISKKNKIWSLAKPAPLRYISQIVSTLYIFFFWREKKEKLTFIGIDPLNAFVGIVLKKINRVEKTIFYTTDYSNKRFTNEFMNWIYHLIDKICVKYADEVWNVSTRIFKIRSKMGIKKTKNILLPNMPSNEYKTFIKNRKNIYHLVTLGVVDDQLDFIGIFQAIEHLKIKYPKILLKIIGIGPKLDRYKEYIKDHKTEKQIKFLGYLKHEKALEEISKSGVGLALYSGLWNFNYYGDSMKCREYFCFGLPVLTTDTHSTVEEIRKYQAGIVTKAKSDEYIKALEKIFQNYYQYEENSFSLRDKYQDIHKRLLMQI